MGPVKSEGDAQVDSPSKLSPVPRKLSVRTTTVESVAAALQHALPPTCGALAVGVAVASVRTRRLQRPAAIFVAIGVGSGVFRFVDHVRGSKNSKLAALLASLAFFRLCSDAHKHIVVSYAVVEAFLQFYLAHRCFPRFVEHAAGVAVTARLMYTFLFHPDWLLPSQLKMLDAQSALPPRHLALLRARLHTHDHASRCAWLHPSTPSCTQHAVDAAGRLALRSARIMAPLHAISLATTLASKKRVRVDAAALDFARSVLFLTGNYLLPYMASCALPQTNHKLMMALAALTPSLAQCVEPPKRRASILKAVTCYSLISLFYEWKQARAMRHLSRRQCLAAAALVYAACMTYILQKPETQSRWVMDFLHGRRATKEKASTMEDHEDRSKIHPLTPK
ncbi:Aste57867_16843 [Aphanomyces stellatus]|uniref:Aste57867_16843 protein n=1 Tax=Aphanomyces stellatus TaxID=120398 RepID=A0A485L9I0_9STRA|nr:hypothetical protein As57867_016785 [Aphanomyces stellatus]VFT93607.1 Aste57867_16843 [Aphanomyces stellatus]